MSKIHPKAKYLLGKKWTRVKSLGTDWKKPPTWRNTKEPEPTELSVALGKWTMEGNDSEDFFADDEYKDSSFRMNRPPPPKSISHLFK